MSEVLCNLSSWMTGLLCCEFTLYYFIILLLYSYSSSTWLCCWTAYSTWLCCHCFNFNFSVSKSLVSLTSTSSSIEPDYTIFNFNINFNFNSAITEFYFMEYFYFTSSIEPLLLEQVYRDCVKCESCLKFKDAKAFVYLFYVFARHIERQLFYCMVNDCSCEASVSYRVILFERSAEWLSMDWSDSSFRIMIWLGCAIALGWNIAINTTTRKPSLSKVRNSTSWSGGCVLCVLFSPSLKCEWYVKSCCCECFCESASDCDQSAHQMYSHCLLTMSICYLFHLVSPTVTGLSYERDNLAVL
jgi:hypothetical protein